MSRRRRLTLDDHVDSIIAAGGPQGALKRVYRIDILDEILHEIHSKGQLLDLRAYHFKSTHGIWREGGYVNYKLARQAIGELTEILKEKHAWSNEQIIQNISKNHFNKELLKYGVTVGGMLYCVYGSSPSRAMIDFLKNHPDEEVSKKFSDLKEYHFGRVQNMWNKKDGTKNFELSRQATGELLDILKKRNGWDYEQVVEKINREHFSNEPIKYNATLRGMLASVYEDSLHAAVKDYFRK